MLLIMLQFITFAGLGATAGAINFNKGELIPSSPVATFDGSDFMISKTSRSEIVGILKSAELPAFLRFTKSTKLVGSGSVLMVLSMMLSAIEKMLIEYFQRCSIFDASITSCFKI